MGTEGYFKLMAKLLDGAAPPAAEDAPGRRSSTRWGRPYYARAHGQDRHRARKPFELSKLDAAVQAVLKDIPQTALKKIEGNKNSMAKWWIVAKGLGTYGTNYLKCATVAAFGRPANPQEDAVYPYTEVDSAGQKLTGANKYTLTFPKDATPPVNGFWAITMYEIDQGWWFVPNALNKYNVSPRNNLKYNADGSLTLYFQNELPGADKEANWLPAPKGDFLPMLRMYWPRETSPSILNDAQARVHCTFNQGLLSDRLAGCDGCLRPRRCAI